MQAKYTVLLCDIMKNNKEDLDKALSTYPIYTPVNEMYYSIIPTREEVNTKLLNHYKYREIGFETVGRFLEELEISMNEIMPYYYQLMKSEDIMNAVDDPFGNVDVTETFEQSSSDNSSGSATSTGSSSGSATSNGKNVMVDTPQNNLSINNIDSVEYASNIDYSKLSSSDETSSTNTSTTESTASGTTTHTLNRKGNQGVNTYAHDMGELRTIFQNIVQMIINDERITELFMNVY